MAPLFPRAEDDKPKDTMGNYGIAVICLAIVVLGACIIGTLINWHIRAKRQKLMENAVLPDYKEDLAPPPPYVPPPPPSRPAVAATLDSERRTPFEQMMQRREGGVQTSGEMGRLQV